MTGQTQVNSSDYSLESPGLVEELRKANDELRNARRAALNLMQDAIDSGEALRVNEQRMRRQKEAFQAAMSGAPIQDCLNRLSVAITEEIDARTAFYVSVDDTGE